MCMWGSNSAAWGGRVSSDGGGGVNRAPKNWGGGRAQLTGTINQLL